jgi:hypothetical protein
MSKTPVREWQRYDEERGNVDFYAITSSPMALQKVYICYAQRHSNPTGVMIKYIEFSSLEEWKQHPIGQVLHEYHPIYYPAVTCSECCSII